MLPIIPIFSILIMLGISWPNCLIAATTHENEAIAQLRQQVLPLQQQEDFAPLLQLCATKKLILLGDGTHGSSEFYSLRRLLSMLLVKNQTNISFIALEADWNSCRSIDRYVRDLPGSPSSAQEALRGFTNWISWVWSNQEMVLLLEELRAINIKRPTNERVAVYGMDMLNYADSLKNLTTIPNYAKEVTTLIACLPDAELAPESYSLQLQNNGKPCTKLAESLNRRVSVGTDIFPRLLPVSSFEQAQQVRVIKSAEAYFRIMTQQPEWAWNIRVRHFANTLYRLLKLNGPSSRGIVWAHNTHVGDARSTAMQQYGMESLGHLLRQQMGAKNVLLLGQTCFNGTVYAARNWAGTATVLPIPPAPDNSVEGLLHRSGIKLGMWLFTPDHRATALNSPRGQRAIGVSYDPSRDATDNYVPTRLTQRYDALIFIDTTTAVAPIN